MATINVPYKVRKGGVIEVKESRDEIKATIVLAKRNGIELITLKEREPEGGEAAFDIKHSLINSMSD